MAVNYKIIFFIVILIVIGINIIIFYDRNLPIEENNLEEIQFFNFNIDFTNFDLIDLPIDSIFLLKAIKGDYIITEGNIRQYTKVLIELDDRNMSQYDELLNSDEKTIVIFPIFTATAYNSPGFYDYFKGQCDETCLTIPIKLILRTEIGGNGAQNS